MNWIDYTKQKPTDKDAQYLVYYEIQHSKGTLASTKMAQWNGVFYKYDYEFDRCYPFNNVKYWMKIEKPMEE